MGERNVIRTKLFTVKKIAYRGWAVTLPQQEQTIGSGGD
jgi:hypothetical protein